MSKDEKIVEQSKKDIIKIKIIEISKIEIVQEFFYAGIGTLTILIIYSLLPSRFWTEPFRSTFCSLIVLLFFIIFILLNQPNSKNKFFRVDYKRNVILFTIFNLAILLFLFFRTEYGYNGLYADNFYRTAYITQMAHSGYPQDMAFKGFSAFMAPLYWYLLALLSKIFLIKPYKMVRIGFLISYYILPILAFEVWKKIVNKKTSFFITAVFFTFIANYFEIIWIDHLIGYLFFIPFFIYYFENYTNKDFKRKDYIIGGFLGSLMACAFYLYFILIPIYLLLNLIQYKIKDNTQAFKEKFRRIFHISVFIFIFSIWFWLPLIINIIFIGFESHQNYFFPKYALDLPFEAYFEFNLFSILLILGVVFILIKYSTSDLMKILGNLVLSVYILYFLGYIGIIIGFPLVHYRVLIVSHYVLIIAFVLFYIQFFNILREHKILDQYKQKVNIRTIEIFVLIIIIFYQNYENTVELYKSEYYERSINQEIPDEIDIFLELDYEDKVFLTQYYEVAAYLPIYLFIVHNAHFSHPSALNNERAKFLKELSECKSSKEFYDKIMNSKFGPIDYFILEPCDDNATEFLFDTAQLEYFPERWDVKIYFREELFESSSYFERYKIKGEIIYRTIY